MVNGKVKFLNFERCRVGHANADIRKCFQFAAGRTGKPDGCQTFGAGDLHRVADVFGISRSRKPKQNVSFVAQAPNELRVAVVRIAVVQPSRVDCSEAVKRNRGQGVLQLRGEFFAEAFPRFGFQRAL